MIVNDAIYTSIYHKLLEILPNLSAIEKKAKSVVDGGSQDLYLEIVRREDDQLVIALTQYGEGPNGKIVHDPDMTIAIYPNKGMAEALTYEDHYIYWEVYSQNRKRVDERAKQHQNQYLDLWLSALIQQGHSI